jgi:hypothetical protein
MSLEVLALPFAVTSVLSCLSAHRWSAVAVPVATSSP